MNSEINYIQVKRCTITPQLREYVLKRDNYTCRYCGSKKEPFHLDHVYPVSKGGETSVQNLVTACRKCNSEKHASIGIYPKPVGYFEPKPKTKNISIISVVILALGISLVWNGFISLEDAYTYGRVCIIFGIMILSISLGRVATGK